MYSFLNILHFLLIILPLIYALQLLGNSNIRSLPNKILGTSMIIISLFYLLNADFLIPSIPLLEYKLYIIYGFILCVNPFYYLYTKALTSEYYKFSKKDLFHLVPTVIFVILDLLVYVPKNHILLNPVELNTIAIIVYNIQTLVYSVLMVMLLQKHNVNLKKYFSFNEDINLNWLKLFVLIFIIISILDIIIYYTHSESLEIYYYFLMIFFFSFLGFFGIRQPEIYHKRIETNNEKDIIDNEKVQSEKVVKASGNKHQTIINEVLKLIHNDKIYLNKKLTIFDISDKIMINKTYISNAINEIYNENFNNFINKFRIEDAKKLIVNKEYDYYTIEAIANQVGFNSKASFNSAFKKFTNKTPSQFKKDFKK